jgi:hypothetical protein
MVALFQQGVSDLVLRFILVLMNFVTTWLYIRLCFIFFFTDFFFTAGWSQKCAAGFNLNNKR